MRPRRIQAACPRSGILESATAWPQCPAAWPPHNLCGHFWLWQWDWGCPVLGRPCLNWNWERMGSATSQRELRKVGVILEGGDMSVRLGLVQHRIPSPDPQKWPQETPRPHKTSLLLACCLSVLEFTLLLPLSGTASQRAAGTGPSLGSGACLPAALASLGLPLT